MLSLCIVNWNTKTLLRECLASIEAFPLLNERTEVIVVDNASQDDSATMVRHEFPGVILVANETNLGYANANNQALRFARGDALLLLNPDVRINETTLPCALRCLRSDNSIGGVGIRQIGPDGGTQRSLRSFPEPMPVFWNVIGLDRVFPKNNTFGDYRLTWFDYASALDVDQPMATFFLVRREVYQQIGGLDPQFPIFFNDVDWCLRIKNAGWRIVYTPDASITHYGGAGTGQAKRGAMARESKLSLLRFYEKHYRSVLPNFVYRAIRVAIGLSIFLQKLRYTR